MGFGRKLQFVGVILKTQVSWEAHPPQSYRDTARIDPTGRVVRVKWYLSPLPVLPCSGPLVVVLVEERDYNLIDSLALPF